MLHRPARTLVSVVGIGVGILLIVFTVGLANGSLRERAQREANIGAEIMFRASGSLGLSGSESLRIPADVTAEIEKVPGVASAVAIGQNSVAVKDATTGTRLIDGVDFASYARIAGLQIVRGRGLAERGNEYVCDAGWMAQKGLKLGDTTPIYEQQFTLVGVYEPSAGARVKIPLATMQEQLGSLGKASAIFVKVADGHGVDGVATELQNRFPENQIILTRELEELYMQGFPALNVFLNVVVGIAGAISALIILLTMYTTVTERTRQIGVLKSLGMSKTGIAWTIVQEALLISFGGILFGVVGSLLLTYAINNWTTLTVQIDPRVVASIVGIGIVSTIIGALYPGVKAARLDAVEALNYD